ncbi:sulfotransferase domain-containing protein [bacterium]|nr:sulfotransferase domain-containing protein [bacterium]
MNIKRMKQGLVAVESGVRGIMPAVKEKELFPTDLILHYSYHKCLTVYYIQVLRFLANEFRFHSEYINTDMVHFQEVVSRPGKKVLHAGNMSDLDLTKLPEYRGSHVVRDPRDLIVSGYHYHKWTEEPWCNDPGFDWTRIVEHPWFKEKIESDQDKLPRGISYKEYLSSLDEERGYLLEILWRDPHFKHMQEWDYNNPNVIEIRYESMIGNETETFRKMFEFYRFHPKLIERGVAIADKFSLKNKAKTKRSHTRDGSAKQWQRKFPPQIKQWFKELHGELLLKLEYESDPNW